MRHKAKQGLDLTCRDACGWTYGGALCKQTP